MCFAMGTSGELEKYLARAKPSIWMEVDLKDKELPTGNMGDTAEQLAVACGVTSSAIFRAMAQARKKSRPCKYVRVILTEETDR